MGELSNALMIIPRTIGKVLRVGTRKGRIDHLQELTKSLTNNTALVAQKYDELKGVEAYVHHTLEKISNEKFEEEFGEIDSLTVISDGDKGRLKEALLHTKEKGLIELAPIIESSQKIKAHMLITLNKATMQKAILTAKSKLAENAHLQLETLKIVERETCNVNSELKDLLNELNTLNEAVLGDFSSYTSNLKATLEQDKSKDVIKHILDKLEKPYLATAPATKEKTKVKKEKPEDK